MKLSEAYDVLGLKDGASEDEVKKRSRELMKKYHPDVNKEKGAEEQFKRINEATERIKSGEPDMPTHQTGNPFSYYDNLGSIFETMFGATMNGRPSRRSNRRPPENIQLRIVLSFEESVVGAQKTVKYQVNDACQTCEGAGTVIEGNGCNACGGRGIIDQVRVMGNIHSTTRSMCPKCMGQVKMKGCRTCGGAKTATRERTQQIHIPPGAKDGSSLRVRGAGHAIVEPMPSGHTDVILNVVVTPDPRGLKMVNNDVVYVAKINLIDALRGIKLKVPTVFGEREIDVPPKTRHSDKVVISGHGVAPNGNQIVTLDVAYPDDISTLVKTLDPSEPS